jgi:DNA replicative helicase MCM subunit Mcm2 (Cdc46/Mcm family)
MPDDSPLDDVTTRLESRIQDHRDNTVEREPRVLRSIAQLAEEVQKARSRVEDGKPVDPGFVRQAYEEVTREVRRLGAVLEDFEVDRSSLAHVSPHEKPAYAREDDD